MACRGSFPASAGSRLIPLRWGRWRLLLLLLPALTGPGGLGCCRWPWRIRGELGADGSGCFLLLASFCESIQGRCPGRNDTLLYGEGKPALMPVGAAVWALSDKDYACLITAPSQPPPPIPPTHLLPSPSLHPPLPSPLVFLSNYLPLSPLPLSLSLSNSLGSGTQVYALLFVSGHVRTIVQWTEPPRGGQPAPRGRQPASEPPLYREKGGGTSLWQQKRWERPDRAGEWAPS